MTPLGTITYQTGAVLFYFYKAGVSLLTDRKVASLKECKQGITTLECKLIGLGFFFLLVMLAEIYRGGKLFGHF